MLDKAKKACRVSTDFYDDEFLDLILAGIADLKLIGIEFDVTEVKEQSVLKDVTITDPLVTNAILTYVRMHFGAPEDFDRLLESYNMQKGQLREAHGYGLKEV